MNIRFTLLGSLFSFNGVIHLFCVTDVFSKYAWVKPSTDEKAKTVLNVSTGTVNKSKCKLNKSGSDQGRNFYNKPIMKVSVVGERFITILKAKSENKWQHLLVVLISII